MKITKSTVTKLLITQIEGLDPVYVFLDDMTANQGRITIVCFDDAWSYYWGSIGDKTIAQFFCGCSDDYLARKFSLAIESVILDPDGFERHAKAHICKLRRNREIEKGEARGLFNEVKSADFDGEPADYALTHRIYGDDWWWLLPKVPNPQYEYLCRIIQVVKKALLEEVKKYE